MDATGPTVIQWQGDVDLHTIAALRQQVSETLASAPSQLVIELSRVTFMDSMGVGLLLETRVGAIRADVRLALRGLRIRERSLLRSTGVLNLFDVQAADRAPADRAPGAGSTPSPPVG